VECGLGEWLIAHCSTGLASFLTVGVEVQCNTEGRQLNFDQVDFVPLSAACISHLGGLPNLFVWSCSLFNQRSQVRQSLARRSLFLVVSSRKLPFSFRRITNGLIAGKTLADTRSESENTGIKSSKYEEPVTLMDCVHWHYEIEHTRYASKALIKL
jgi:hypothetical protein